MNQNLKLTYYDLREEAKRGRLRAPIGRRAEMGRLDRLIARRASTNALIFGRDVGKTTLVHGWMQRLAHNPVFARYALIQLDAAHILDLDDDPHLEERYSSAFASMPPSVVFVDDFGRTVYRKVNLLQRVHRLYGRLLARPDTHLVLVLEIHEYAWIKSEYPAFLRSFETLNLQVPTPAESTRILARATPRLNAKQRVIVPDDALREIVASAERFPTLGELPRAAIRILDESLSLSNAHKRKVLSSDTIAEVIESKTGVPRPRLARSERDRAARLHEDLGARIIGQEHAIASIAAALQRAMLGLKDPRRPLGSFLLLGPSGVGKTETAKSVAELVFGRSESFVRIDMSEFQQEHAIQRLVGAPPGYIGYDEGGALTNALKKEPYCLILLDEIEKAHPRVFDIFLQVLDDGRLTSGQNETVDARNAIIVATSNAAVPDILAAHERGILLDEKFAREKLTPALAQTFRLEFINRFDSLAVFKPLSPHDLARVAQLEIAKIERRFAKHKVRFRIEPSALAERIQSLADPRFGARPVKRFIEETCETLLMQSLLSARA